MDEVAQALVRGVAAGPSGRLPDMGGPEVLTGKEILQTWLEVRRLRHLVLPIKPPGKVFQSFRQGYHTCPENKLGKRTWRAWVTQTYAYPPPPGGASSPPPVDKHSGKWRA